MRAGRFVFTAGMMPLDPESGSLAPGGRRDNSRVRRDAGSQLRFNAVVRST